MKLKGGAKGFLVSWAQVIAGLRKAPEEYLLEPLFLEQSKGSQALKSGIEVYRRAKKGDKRSAQGAGCGRTPQAD